MKNSRLYLITLGLFAILAVVFLTAIELYLKWSAAAEAPEHRDHVIETPYLPVKFKPDYKGQFWNIPFSTNRFGFRDEENLAQEPGTNEVRVLSLGDSIGFGLGIPPESHYTQIAERLINPLPREKTIRLINAGGQGYSPSGYYVYLKHEGKKLRPDLVLVEIELCNDVTDEALLRWQVPPNGVYPDRIVGGRYLVSWDGHLIGTYSIGSYFFEKTYLYTEFIRRLLFLSHRISPQEPFHSQPGAQVYYSLGFDRYLLNTERLEQGWDRLFRALEGLYSFCKENDMEFLLMLMPSRYLYEEKEPYTSYAQNIFDRAIAKAHSRKLPMIDISTVIEQAGGKELFFDFAHLTMEGNRAVGKALAEELSRRQRHETHFKDNHLSR